MRYEEVEYLELSHFSPELSQPRHHSTYYYGLLPKISLSLIQLAITVDLSKGLQLVMT